MADHFWYPRSDEQEHDDKMAETAAHHEQMEDLMAAEVRMAVTPPMV